MTPTDSARRNELAARAGVALALALIVLSYHYPESERLGFLPAVELLLRRGHLEVEAGAANPLDEGVAACVRILDWWNARSFGFDPVVTTTYGRDSLW